MPSAARTGAHRLHPCGQSHTPPRRAQIIENFTSTKFQNWIKGTRDKESTEPVLSFMDMKAKDKVKNDKGEVAKDDAGKDKEYIPAGSNFLIYLSKFFPTVIWSIIQLGIVLVFAGIYMSFPCYDFVVPDEDTSCTDGYQKSTSTLCAAPPCRSTPFRAARSPPAHPGNSRLRCGTRLSR